MGVRLYVGPAYVREEVKSTEKRWVSVCQSCKYQKPVVDRFCGHCGVEASETPGVYSVHYGDPIRGLQCWGRYCIPLGESFPEINLGFGDFGCVIENDCSDEAKAASLLEFSQRYPAPSTARLLWVALAWDDCED